MKLGIVIFLFSGIIFLAGCAEQDDPAKLYDNTPVPADTLEKVSYSMGHQIGATMRKDSMNLLTNYFFKGIIDGLENDSAIISAQDMDDLVMDYQRKLSEKRSQMQEEEFKVKRQQLAQVEEINKEQGEQFLAENKKKPGWKTTESGVQYKVVKEGTGLKVAPTDMVLIHIVGKFIDGTEFDNSLKRGKAVPVPVMQLPPGWSEIMKMMREGDQWEVVIPSDLAFGPGGIPQMIPPNSILVLDLQILEVMDQSKIGPPSGMQPPQNMPVPPSPGN